MGLIGMILDAIFGSDDIADGDYDMALEMASDDELEIAEAFVDVIAEESGLDLDTDA